MTDSTRVDGQVAIVTGAAQGIGRGIANVLSKAGANIVIGDIQPSDSTVNEINSIGGSAAGMVMDTSKPEESKALVKLALEKFGQLDILVNNAAIDAPSGNAWDLSDEEWQRTIEVNLGGVFYCSRASLQPMLKSGKGCIVSISSQSALMGAEGCSPAYNASKAGVLGLTMALSAQVAHRGVRVNAIMPSLVESRDFGWSEEDIAARLTEYPLGFGTPTDIGEAVRYLVSPASRWASGTALRINGGFQRSTTWY